MNPIVLVVEDHVVLAEGLVAALSAEGIAARAHAPSSAEDVVRAVADARPQLVLLDLDLGLPDGDGVDLLGPLRSLGAGVLVLTGSTDRVVLARCIEAGALGVTSKREPFDRVLDAVRRAVRGEPSIGLRHRQELLDDLRRDRRARAERLAPFETLTPREASVLAALAEGRTAEAIARDAFVSLPTVRSQIRGILVKLGVRSQLAAVAMAIRSGWLDDAQPPRAARR